MTVFLVMRCFLISLFALGGSSSNKQPQNKFVTCTVSFDSLTVHPGSKGALLLMLKPREGIHINIEPRPTFVFDSSSVVTADGKIEVTHGDSSAFLSKQKPMKQGFAIPITAKTGTVTLKGILTYYYCSDAEGWCSRFKQPVEATIEVNP